ncbi:hypothetical protein TVAG_567390 [Trichomonas vaginalis G3]|uniref:Uncharacterized protein n=1 Tax=Trichomonas vaginalis (strain ATCC PRA-98 / G3) TaxID=412133 RepID=A2GDJ6_TRIV3|nr:hypothetical protein TVAGG3_0326940 [Trichomonas vaginalis G3]XP_051077866.1 hypothetical protein TVAGG3_0922190 [Trichomonas vaginalis G3]EAX84770.1 hypothetical protein TVAG_567390 [Trichomonas vaginalis G3]KAI5485203.1 hypothetical protein TVAGG3_0922190 [Trichomonas vaginalis G3]KAI5529700.1 hypothetical protein TVAGG3_0326940 [Trichomonas vaginalis G3]|eukprot:XP_001297700.1 hypothetical protein [Trichomonas vaginalis G3]
MSFTQTDDMRAAKDQLLKELIRNSPKKYKAVIISTEDYDKLDANESEVLPESPKRDNMSQNILKHHSHPKHHHHSSPKENSRVICSRCARELSRDHVSRINKTPRHHHRCYAPPKYSQTDPKIQQLIERRIQKARMQQAMEQRRLEAEAIARARAQYEFERKQKVQTILEEVRMRKELEKMNQEDEMEGDYSDYYDENNDYSDYAYSDNEENEDDDGVVESLQKIAENLQKASQQLTNIVSNSMSPKKGSPARKSNY